MPWSTRCAAAARPIGPAPMTTTGSSMLAGAFTVDSSVFRHLSMACAVSMAPDSMSVNIDIRRIWRSLEHVGVVVVGTGQAGLATAYALVRHGLRPVVLEAFGRSVGSWPRYYDCLTCSRRPGSAPFPGCRSAAGPGPLPAPGRGRRVFCGLCRSPRRRRPCQ
ncbi:NAD(P)-binding protein [Streptomyces sp. NPDC020858]|uniref:NAD(P)-binding protein n=1 Tax=Streptomyces sp. NPDC020858 TaxID=3365097 RepID=UPI0037AC5386